MHFIRIIQAATKSTTRTKKLTKKPSKKLPKTAPKRTLTKNKSKGIKPSKTSVTTRNKPVNRRFKIQKPKGIYPLQDVSTQTFEELKEQGYNRCTFVAWSGACQFCKKLNGKTWTLDNFLRTTQYEAPVFSHSHVNAQSEIKVWDIKGELPDVFVNYNGDIH